MKVCLIVLLVVIFANCNKHDEYQMNLSEDVLIELLIDMHLAEGGLARVKKSEVDSLREVYYKSILMKYDLSEEEHMALINHIKKDPVYMG